MKISETMKQMKISETMKQMKITAEQEKAKEKTRQMEIQDLAIKAMIEQGISVDDVQRLLNLI
jgi:hypothetical protein